MTTPCPRCGGTTWFCFDGNDRSCMNCGYVKYGGSNNDDVYAEVMEQAPGQSHGPGCDCKDCVFFRYEAEVDRQRELMRR